MFRNYFKIALRQLFKQKMYSLVKIGGLAMSIAACFLISLFIRDEFSYDRSYPHANRLYRIVNDFNDNGKITKGADFPAPFAGALKTDFPEVEKAGRLMPDPLFYGAGSNEVKRQDQEQNSYEEGFAYADQELLDIFGIPMIYGEPRHALDKPNVLVLSKRKADKYFPHENPVGKILYLNNDRTRPFRIGGVMEDFPANSHIHYDFLLTLKGVELWPEEQTNWAANNYYTYVLLHPGTNPRQFASKLLVINKKYVAPALRNYGISDPQQLANSTVYHLQPVEDIHLKSYDIRDDLQHGDIRFVWLFGGITGFILLIACINFINLSTAKSANRAKEVGLRKVIGSHRADLIRQFLTESFLFSLFSFVLGILIAWTLLPYFNTMAAKSIIFPWKAWWLIPVLVLSAALVGFLAGIYPSFYLSAFKPIQVLKGQLSRGSKNAGLRSVLVVFQFTTSIILIIGTIIIYLQTQFILHTKVGFNKDQVILIQGTNTLGKELKSFKEDLMKLPQIKNVSVSDYLPISGTKRNGHLFWREGKEKQEPGLFGQFWVADEDYINTLGMHLVEGRNFSKGLASDSGAMIINQIMAGKLNLGKDPIGKRVSNGEGIFTVIGVLEDFNYESMRSNPINPLAMVLGNSPSIVSVKVNVSGMSAGIRSISALWKKFSPDQPIRFVYLDESFAVMYADVQRTGLIFTSFAGLAILIACLGLFALSAFLTEQRSKEVGIRKTLGASVTQVTALLSKDFARLVSVAVLIASPIAWWAMNKWLQDFEYRITISWWVFVAAGLLVIVIALGTIMVQCIKAARANPVQSLKSE